MEIEKQKNQDSADTPLIIDGVSKSLTHKCVFKTAKYRKYGKCKCGKTSF
jgi:hypothetical protein